jgi:uncharacterized protein (UPF0335 family)
MSDSTIAADQLRSFIERIERLEEEKAALSSDIREVYAELKATGFEPKTVREIVRLRKLDSNELQEQEALLDTYKTALGMA